MEQIISIVSSALIVIAASVLYVFLITNVLPYFLLSPRYSKQETKDRGIKKCVFPEGRGVVYEPAVRYRRYVKKYLLFEYNGNKFLKCKLAENVTSIKYDVAIYDVRNRIIKYLELTELVLRKGETKNTLLPKDASYAMIIVRNANGNELANTEKIKDLSVLSRGIFAAATTVLTVAIGVAWRAYLVWLMTLLGADFDISVLLTLIASIAVGVILAVVGILIYSPKRFLKGSGF